MSQDVIFDESALWYLRPTPTTIHSIPNSEDEANEAEMSLDGEEIGALEEIPITFQLSGSNEELSRKD